MSTRKRKQAQSTLSEAARAAQREYKREWAKKNPDKVKAYLLAYWERKGRELEAAQGNTEGRHERKGKEKAG